MSKLYFKVGSDWEEVVRLRNEIAKLKQELKGMDGTQSPAAFKTLNTQLAASTQRMNELVNEAAKAGVAMEGDFKKKIFDASQSVNSFTEKIIAQKNAIGSLQTTIRKNKELYKNIVSRGNEDKELLNHIREQERALGKERDALFGLTQEQANARLSVKKLRDEYALYKNDGKQVVEVNNGIAISWKKALAVIGGAGVLKALGSEIIRVRGEFQSMQTAIETMVGKDVAGKLMPQIKELAKILPLAMTDMVGAEKMMLGFNIQAEDTIKYLKALSDISMGESGKFNSLTLAFSQMSATGKLMGQDLNQMINAGFNPLQTISEKTGKSIATLKDEMSKGAISAEMVQQAFIDATSAGGKFYNMSENASQTINGQMSMMQDAWDSVFNELGTKSEGVIIDGIQMTTSLIENYETVGKVLTGLVVTYGTYRTAVMLVAAAESKHTLVEIGLTNVRILARKAQLALNAAMLTNPYVALATVVIGLTTAMWAMSDSTTAAEKATRKYNEEQECFQKAIDERKQKIEQLIRVIQDETETEYTQIKAYEELQRLSPALTEAYTREQLATASLTDTTKRLNEELDKINYDNIIKQIEKYKRLVHSLSNENDWNNVDLFTRQEHPTGSISDALEQDKANLEKWQNNLAEYNRLKKQAEEDAKPIEVKLLEAQNNRDEIIQEFAAAKFLLETEQRKIQESGFGIIPIDVQIRFDNAQGALLNIDNTISSLKQEQTKPETTNKKYWETKKKEAQERLDALTDIEAAGSKGAALKAKINEYDKKINTFSTNTTKQENQAEKLRQQREKLTQEIEKSAKERQEAIINSEFNTQQMKIDLMEEGADKELAQIQLNYERQYKEIADRERWLLEKIQEEEKKRWEKDNPDYEKKGMKFTPTTTSLSPEQRKSFDKEYSLAYQKQEKDTQELLNKLLEKYRDYDAQRTAIEKSGNAEIAYLQSKRTDVNANEIDRAIKVAKQKIKEGVQAVNDAEAEETSKDNSFLRNLFGDTSQMAFKDLQNLIDQAKQLQSYLSSSGDSKGLTFISAEQLKTIESSPDELDKLKKALDKLLKGGKGNEWDEIFDGFTKGFAKLKSSNGFKETSEGLQDIEEAASKASSMLGGVAGDFASMFEAMGNTGAADAMTGVQDAMTSITNIGQGVAKGGIVGGIAAAVGEAANWIGKAFAANARHKAALKEIMNETIAQQREYNLLLMQQNLEYEKASTIFGTDVYGKAANAVTVMKDAVAGLNEELRGSGEYEGGYIKIVGRTFDILSKSTRQLYDSYAGLANIEIKTGHKKTGLFGWGKGKDIYSSILDVYPELIKANGEFDASLAETIINTRTMSDDSKNALQNMIDLANQAKEAYEAINDYFTDIFGDLGATMMDALVDAFKSGTDVAQSFTDSISGMLETLAKQMIYSATLAPLLESAQNKMMEVMKNAGLSDEEKFGQWTEILNNLTDDAIVQQELANKLLEEYKKMAAEKGFDIFQPDESTKEAFDSFISQMKSTFTSLELTAKDVSDNIYDYFHQAMINALYEKEYKSKMEELYKTFEELSKDGLSESDMAQLGSQVDQYIEQMMKGVESVNSIFADKLKDAEDLQSFVDNVKSAMSSIEATAEDVTDNIFEYIRQQMVDKMFADTFQPQIEEFYKKVQEAMFDGDITDAERNALRSEAEKLANDITTAKDILSDTLGITESSLKKELEVEFKSFSDGILNSLYNAEVTAESVAKDIAESMRKELIEAMYIEQYEPRIKAIWEKWKEYSADGLVTDEERANIKTDIDELSKEVSDTAKEISDAWTDSGEEVKKAFESFSDSIKNVLYDAEATAEDVANNIYQYMRNALVDSMFTAQLQPQIQAWYDKYTEFMKDGAIDTAERKTLDEMIAEIQKAGVDIVDAANALFPSLDTGAIKRAEEAAQEAENARNEAEQEWESFSDGILNSLYDIEATAEDISDDMSEYMRKALIKAMYVENFKPQMQKWYNEWQRAMGDDNLTSEEKQLLDSMKQTMVDDMKKEVDAINQFFGTMFSQQASSKGFEAMSQDTGEELNGRFTALQVAGEEIKNQAVQQTGLLSSIDKRLSLIDITNDDIPALMSGTPNFVDKTRGIITNSYQSQINVVFPTEDIKVLTDKVSSMERIVDEMRTFQVEGNIARRDIVENSAILAKNSPKILAGTDEIKRNLKNL